MKQKGKNQEERTGWNEKIDRKKVGFICLFLILLLIEGNFQRHAFLLVFRIKFCFLGVDCSSPMGIMLTSLSTCPRRRRVLSKRNICKQLLHLDSS